MRTVGVVTCPSLGRRRGWLKRLQLKTAILDDCGGLPRQPLPPLGYQVVFRLASVRGFLAPQEFLAGDRFEPFLTELRRRGAVITAK